VASDVSTCAHRRRCLGAGLRRPQVAWMGADRIMPWCRDGDGTSRTRTVFARERGVLPASTRHHLVGRRARGGAGVPTGARVLDVCDVVCRAAQVSRPSRPFTPSVVRCARTDFQQPSTAATTGTGSGKTARGHSRVARTSSSCPQR
jgi:hypothetical protein